MLDLCQSQINRLCVSKNKRKHKRMNDETINVNTQNQKGRPKKLIAKQSKMRRMVILRRSVLQGGGTATTWTGSETAPKQLFGCSITNVSLPLGLVGVLPVWLRAWICWVSNLLNRVYACFHPHIFLFLFGCAGSSLPCGLFSGCGEWGLLSSCSTWTPRAETSLVVKRGL